MIGQPRETGESHHLIEPCRLFFFSLSLSLVIYRLLAESPHFSVSDAAYCYLKGQISAERSASVSQEYYYHVE